MRKNNVTVLMSIPDLPWCSFNNSYILHPKQMFLCQICYKKCKTKGMTLGPLLAAAFEFLLLFHLTLINLSPWSSHTYFNVSKKHDLEGLAPWFHSYVPAFTSQPFFKPSAPGEAQLISHRKVLLFENLKCTHILQTQRNHFQLCTADSEAIEINNFPP